MQTFHEKGSVWNCVCTSSYRKLHWGFTSTVLPSIDVLSIGWWEDNRTAEAEKTRNIRISHNSSKWREGGAGETSKCVERMENQNALERRGKEKGRRAEKLHTNPKPPQEQEMRVGAVVCPGQRWLGVTWQPVVTGNTKVHARAHALYTYSEVQQDFCLSAWVCLSGREYPHKVMWHTLRLFSTSLENTEPLQLPCVQLDPKPCLPYFQEKDLLEYIGKKAASLQWYSFTVQEAKQHNYKF